MDRRGPLHDVELVEDDEPGTDEPGTDGAATPGTSSAEPPTGPPDTASDPDHHPRRRRALVVGAALLAVLVTTGVVGQVVVDRRERAQVAAVAAQPMAVGLLDGPPTERWEMALDGRNGIADVHTAGGVLVGVRQDTSGPVTVTGRDGGTGAELWQVDLVDGSTRPEPPPGAEAFGWSGRCLEHPDGGELVVCLVHDGMNVLVDEVWSDVPPSHVLLVVLDARDGSVVRDLTDAVDITTMPTSITVVGDLAVVAASVGTQTLVRAVTVDGEHAWETTVPSGDRVDGLATYVTALGDLTALVTPTELRLVDATGRTASSHPLGDRWVRENGDGSALFLEPSALEYERGADGVPATQVPETLVLRADGDVTVSGTTTYVTLDDGSVPGLVLTEVHGRLTAWDGAGTQLWSSDVATDLSSVVMDGRVHVRGATELVTLDARTGAELWRSDATTALPVTDGRHLLALAAVPSRGASRQVVALDPADGSEMWRAPVPDTAEELVAHLRLLVAVEHPVGGVAAQEGRLVVLG